MLCVCVQLPSLALILLVPELICADRADAGMQEDAAQLCYLVAGLMPQPYDPAARLCLLGADHRAAPRSLASIPALQRTEVLEWAKLPGEYSLSPL